MDDNFALRAVSPTEFCASVVPALMEREAENGLPFGIALRLAQHPDTSSDALLLAIESAGAVDGASSVVGAAVWMPPHDVVATRLPPGAAELVAERCLRARQPVTGASGPEGTGLELAEHLARHSGAEVMVRKRQFVYELSKLEAVTLVNGAMRPATLADLPLVADWYSRFVREADVLHPSACEDWARASITSGSAFLWQDEREVRSLACLSRETPNGRTIGPVYTPPLGRRRGYATSLVSELARHVLASGKRFAVLFTDAENPTSNHIYQAIGFRLVCRYDAYAIAPRT